jgi:NNP family nitrate/nitrite transporter-like MFS transporter
VTSERHTWVLSFLYIGTFGSFIGFSFAFGQVLLVQFPDTFTKPIDAAYVTFLGPLIGSLIRPVGGKLADAFGGARVTFLNFVGMAAAAGLVLAASLEENLPLFIAGFITLFVFAGVGNGSTYKMIPTIFESIGRRAVAAGADEEDEKHRARRLSGALIGVAGAIGALGGVGVNVAFRESFLANGNGNAAYVAFIAFYVVCVALTWAVYMRRRAGRLAGV